MNPPSSSFKRYCKTLTLQDNPDLIAEYERVHRSENMWPEITQGMKSVGILRMEIYRHNTLLFMIMDTVADFDHDQAMGRLAALPRQAKWEAFVSRFQQSNPTSSAEEKWQLMHQVYKLI